MNKAILYYVYDPMCSWCWGYHNTWSKLQLLLNEQTGGKLTVQTVLGGLAPDSDEPMPIEMQKMLQQTWSRIHSQLGTEFNFDFWTKCQPKRSTYPACRATLVARENGKEEAMYQAIQRAYYLHAQNPSEIDTLISLAGKIGLDTHEFEGRLQSSLIDQQLEKELKMARRLPIQGFPSLVLSISGKEHSIDLDYLQAEKTLNAIQALIN